MSMSIAFRRFRSGAMTLSLLAIVPLISSCASTRLSEEVDGPAEAMRRHVAFLASDALEGRGAGYPGEAKAAAYIEGQFRAMGLETHVQKFTFLPRGPERVGDELTSCNVLAILPGSDPSLEGEVIVIGAHHDGQGKAGQADGGRLQPPQPSPRPDDIWNSADDNASSVAAIIEIARHLAKGSVRPRRSIVFATFGAEEHSLNGAAHLATHAWPEGRRVAAMINVEKIGRVPSKPLIAAGCSTSRGWSPLIKEANATAGQTVECILPELVPDTDHYPFGAMGTPAIVLGVAHEEDTHLPTDETERIDASAMAARGHYIETILRLLADREDPMTFDRDADRGPGLVVVPASANERLALATGDRGALKVGMVLPGLPADRAGMRPGDFVMTVNGAAPEPESGERSIQQTLAEHGSVALTVWREGGIKTITITVPGSPPPPVTPFR
jgi:hypothetical protein